MRFRGILIDRILYIWQLFESMDWLQIRPQGEDVPMLGCFLISFRSAFLPPFAAAKVLSHSFNSARRDVAESAVVESAVVIIAYRVVGR